MSIRQLLRDMRQNVTQTNETDVDHHNIRRLIHMKIANISLFIQLYVRIITQTRMHLISTNINSYDFSSTAPERIVSKSARRRSNVEHNLSLEIKL